MGAPKGNDFNLKWKTEEQRKKACKAICAHLEQGFNQESFPDADWDTVERYIKEYPKDFPAEKINEAKRKGMLKWESIGMDGTTGDLKGFNPTSWIFTMKNKYSNLWRDKHEVDNTSSDGSMRPQKITIEHVSCGKEKK